MRYVVQLNMLFDALTALNLILMKPYFIMCNLLGKNSRKNYKNSVEMIKKIIRMKKNII